MRLGDGSIYSRAKKKKAARCVDAGLSRHLPSYGVAAPKTWVREASRCNLGELGIGCHPAIHCRIMTDLSTCPGGNPRTARH
jgi:hypothetical protein